MREIKFRAWDKLEMRYSVWPTSNNTTGSWKGKNECIFHDHGGDNVFLMQYTGLTDKNGQGIYEGDIVDTHHTNNYEVKWYERKAGFYLFKYKDEFPVCLLWEP